MNYGGSTVACSGGFTASSTLQQTVMAMGYPLYNVGEYLAATTTPSLGSGGSSSQHQGCKMPDSPQDIKPLSPTQLPKVSSMQVTYNQVPMAAAFKLFPCCAGVNGAHSPPCNAGNPVPVCPNPAAVRSLSPPSDSNHGSGSTGVSSSTAASNVSGGSANIASVSGLVEAPSGVVLGARQLSKVKRFLTTLQQFASDVSPDVGERVHGLILGLVSSTISIEDFHHSIQDITNYPLRPFVVPFLKSHLPLLQTELVHYARAAKQSPAQYLRQHEQLVLDQPGGEPFEIFQPDAKEGAPLKRRTPPDGRPKENGHAASAVGAAVVLEEGGPPAAKRHQPLSASPGAARLSPGVGAHAAHPPPAAFRFEEASAPLFRDRYDRYDRLDRDFYRPCYGMLHRDYPEDRDMEDEWKNINTMLNCILGMVEKTKRAIAILQHRSQAERPDFSASVWTGSRRHLDVDYDLKKRDLMAHYKSAAEIDRVSEVRRRAEEAVNEVKRQAVAELQKAVSAAESKASELVAAERTKMERLLGEARRQAAEEALAAVNHQEDSTEQNCWNCGRKANETCSGCNVARYCGAFCQHKDWENHHRVCGQPSTSPSSSGGGPVGKRSPTPPRRLEGKVDSRH
ncbi:protein CBFA2T1 isoform X3 [Dermacentor silvarum]|uniref:protein CBFA2T1 isoform X3 n=1 Tax=Dermacentor silvarum TaxID=543639 RepID=UPI0021010C47|nr:protein CBFA2T1 isoform X3 [Dermacentor silvarum]